MIYTSLSISFISLFLLILLYKNNKFILNVVSKINSEFAKEFVSIVLVLCVVPILNLISAFVVIIFGIVILLKSLYEK